MEFQVKSKSVRAQGSQVWSFSGELSAPAQTSPSSGGGGVTAIGIVRPVVRPCRAAASLNPQRLFLLATHSAHCSLVVFLPLVLLTFKSGASQVVQAVKNPPANAGDTGDTGSVPGWGRSSGERPWQPTPAFLPGKSPRRSVEWQRVEHN